jgi:hypothetical protein
MLNIYVYIYIYNLYIYSYPHHLIVVRQFHPAVLDKVLTDIKKSHIAFKCKKFPCVLFL